MKFLSKKKKKKTTEVRSHGNAFFPVYSKLNY
jgi:hypothetical protein